MTSYFDAVFSSVTALKSDPNKYDTIKNIEDKIVFDVTICAMQPDFPSDLRVAIHRIILRCAVYNLPPNAPEKDFATWEDHIQLMNNLHSDLHDVFHALAYRGLPRYSDSPLTPLQCLYADGDMEREAMITQAGEQT